MGDRPAGLTPPRVDLPGFCPAVYPDRSVGRYALPPHPRPLLAKIVEAARRAPRTWTASLGPVARSRGPEP